MKVLRLHGDLGQKETAKHKYKSILKSIKRKLGIAEE